MKAGVERKPLSYAVRVLLTLSMPKWTNSGMPLGGQRALEMGDTFTGISAVSLRPVNTFLCFEELIEQASSAGLGCLHVRFSLLVAVGEVQRRDLGVAEGAVVGVGSIAAGQLRFCAASLPRAVG